VRIEVGPLPERDLRSLAVIAVGGPVDGATLQHWWRRAGQRAVLRELVQSAQESGALASELGLWRLKGSLAHSPRLRGLIEQRLTGLSDDEREASSWSPRDPIPCPYSSNWCRCGRSSASRDAAWSTRPSVRTGPSCGSTTALREVVRRTFLDPATRLCRSLAEAAESDVAPTGRDAVRIAVWQLDGAAPGASRPCSRRTDCAAHRVLRAGTADGPGGVGPVQVGSRPLSC